jgi:hypothetical protein
MTLPYKNKFELYGNVPIRNCMGSQWENPIELSEKFD